MESNCFCLFVLLEVNWFCVERLSVLWLDVRNLGRGRRGVIGKIEGDVCAGKWVCGKRVIV